MVPEADGKYWYRGQHRNRATGEVTWGRWEIVSLSHYKPRGKHEYRFITAAFTGWRGRVDKMFGDLDTSGLRVEFQKIEEPND